MDFPNALKAADRALELDPTFSKALVKKGNAHFGMKEYKKVIKNLIIRRLKLLKLDLKPSLIIKNSKMESSKLMLRYMDIMKLKKNKKKELDML
jgi:hypothetical protein